MVQMVSRFSSNTVGVDGCVMNLLGSTVRMQIRIHEPSV